MVSPYKSKNGPARLFDALRNSANGLRSAFRQEAAFRQELLLCAVLVPVAIWISETLVEAAILIGALVFVLIIELLNSALETIADAVTLDKNTLIGRAKDIGSAAVLLSIILAALTWVAVIWG